MSHELRIGRQPLALAALAVSCALLGVPSASPVRAADAPPSTSRISHEDATFTIWQGDRKLGTEEILVYSSHDTLVTASTTHLELRDTTAAGGTFPYEKRTTFLQRLFDSYPLLFQSMESERGDTASTRSLNCLFRDTTAVVYTERAGKGQGDAVALPPGRLYILDQGVYLQVEILAADFATRQQQVRKQYVLIPARHRIAEVELRRGPSERMTFEGKEVETVKVEISDATTLLRAWIAPDGRMLKLEAPSARLRVERGPERASAQP